MQVLKYVLLYDKNYRHLLQEVFDMHHFWRNSTTIFRTQTFYLNSNKYKHSFSGLVAILKIYVQQMIYASEKLTPYSTDN